MDRFRTVGFIDFSSDYFCRFAKMQLSLLLDRRSNLFFQNKVLYEMALVSEVLEHIGLKLGKYEKSKTQTKGF